MSKILFYGLSSFKNKGCEAIVNTTLKQLNKDDEVTIATFDFDHDKKYFKNRVKKYVKHYENDKSKFTKKDLELHSYYESIPFDYNNFELLYQKKVVEEIKNCDICIHIGGDNYCYGYNEWLYALNTIAKKYNKITILWCASLFETIDDPNLIEDLNKYDLIILRELTSYNAVKKYISEEKLMLSPDPAFALDKKEVKLDKWYDTHKDILGLNLSPLTIKNDEDYKTIIDYIKYLLKNSKLGITLLPHVTQNSSNDLNILCKIKQDFKNENRVFLESSDYDCEEIKYIISKCKYIVTARTHASIASYSLNIPTLVIGYSIKSLGLADLIFGSHDNTVVDSKNLTLDDLINKTNYMFEHETELKNKLEKQTNKLIKDSKLTYSKATQKLKYNDEIHVVSKTKCTGCMACLNSCPFNAIKVAKTDNGFEYPYIDKSLCKNCGNCKKVCPILNNNENDDLFKPLFYAAKSKDLQVKLHSSSGGLFYHLAKYILKNNGIIYGATMNKLNVSHIRIDKIDDLYKIQKSKYIQSSTIDIFNQVKKDLEKKKTVLFTGTPCQISAIKNYTKDNQNLICMSIVCHGVTSDYFLNKHIKDIEDEHNCKITDIDFRSKKNSWENYQIEYKYSNGSISTNFNEDPMLIMFLNNYNLRESCYDCKFKGLKNNKADIILGDYWGIYNCHKDFFDKYGVSSVVILTKTGEKIFNGIKKEIDYISTKYTYIKKYNPSIESSSEKPYDNLLTISEVKNSSVRSISKIKIMEKELEELKKQNKILEDSSQSKIHYLENENKKIYEECITLNKTNQYLEDKNKENNQIINSKRFKLMNKIFYPVDKLRRKK